MHKISLNIEIASSQLRYIFSSEEGRGVKFLKAGTMNHRMDIAVPGALKKALSELIESSGIHPDRVAVALSRPETLIRQIVFPIMKEGELEEALAAEIEKLPTFSRHTFHFIYKAYPEGEDSLRVFFAVVYQDFLKYIYSEVEAIGLEISEFDITPLNVIGLPIFHQSKETEALLVINDYVSHLIIAKDNQFKFVYQTTVGLERFRQPQGVGVDAGILANYAAEIQRVIRSYSIDRKGEVIKKVSLLAEHSVVKDLDRILEPKLGVKVQWMNWKELNANHESEFESIDPIFILPAIPMFYRQSKLKTIFSLEHFSQLLNGENYVRKITQASLTYGLIILLVLGGLTVNFFFKKTSMVNMNKKITAQIANLRTEKKQYLELKDQQLALRRSLMEQAQFVQKLNRISWSQVLFLVAQEMPENLSLNSFKFDEHGNATFIGDAMQVESIAELLRRVDESSILEKAKFDYLTEKNVDTQKIFKFGILAHLKEDISHVSQN